jgi:NAD(P)H-hydrate repair Nnr-like enzyme with NAD(P)H-hydrate dehydratase domain
LIITPNAGEFSRICKLFFKEVEMPPIALKVDDELMKLQKEGEHQLGCFINNDHPHVKDTHELAKRMKGVTILRKGTLDIISNATKSAYSATKGCPRRCGGQGDVTTGITSTFVAFAKLEIDKQQKKDKERQNDKPTSNSPLGDKSLSDELLVAVLTAASITRKCAENAFQRRGRSMVARDLIDSLPDVMEELFSVRPKL